MAPSPTSTPQEVVDALLYDDTSSVRVKKMLLDVRQWVADGTFAEDFLEKGGLDALLKLVRSTSGAVQGLILQAVHALLVYLNALETFADHPELVDRIYHLLAPPEPGVPVNLTVAKAALQVLVVICGKLDNGHQYINDAAKRKVSADSHAYAILAPLLTSNDLICVSNTLLLMNLLVAKRKAVADIKAKRLFFKWQQAGLMQLLKPLDMLDDPAISKQLTVLQKSTGYTIPKSWLEAHKFKLQYMDIKKRYDQANEQLFVLQQQQAKVRLMKLEFQRAQVTLRALGAVMPTASTVAHPTKRFSEGGGIALKQLSDPTQEPIDVDSAAIKETTDIQKKLLESLLKQPDLAALAGNMVGGGGGAGPSSRRGGRAGRHGDPYAHLYMHDDADFPPPPDDSDDELLPPPDDDDDDLPPPMDDDDDLPPPMDDDDDDLPPGTSGGGGRRAAGGAGVAADGTPLAQGSADGTSAQPGASGEVGAAAATAAFGEAQVGASDVAPGLATTTTPAAVGGPPPPPPPPPPPGRKGGPPPPPPGKRGVGAASNAAPSRSFFKGPAPGKKMKPLHWDKWPMDDTVEKGSIWGRVHSGEINCDFDYAEFEAMFSQKEVEKKEVKKKVEKVLLLDSKSHQNLSIMLHKLPTIPTIQNALLTLDSGTLEPPMLLAMTDPKLLTPDVIKTFTQKQNDKPVTEYEPPEQFVAMALSVPKFQQRCSAWLFTFEWDGNVERARKPIERLRAGIVAVMESKQLPYFLGLLLGFGNMMNHGNSMKGNAPAINISTLGKIDATKDNRSKTSLMQHLIDTARKRNPDALILADELKPLDDTSNLKIDDVEKAVTEAAGTLNVFQRDVTAVKRAVEQEGTAEEDPFIPFTAEYLVRAQEQLASLKAAVAELQELAKQLQVVLGVPSKKPMKPEEIFEQLAPLLGKVKGAASELAKERKRQQRKGQKMDANLESVVGALQEQVVAGN